MAAPPDLSRAVEPHVERRGETQVRDERNRLAAQLDKGETAKIEEARDTLVYPLDLLSNP